MSMCVKIKLLFVHNSHKKLFSVLFSVLWCDFCLLVVIFFVISFPARDHEASCWIARLPTAYRFEIQNSMFSIRKVCTKYLYVRKINVQILYVVSLYKVIIRTEENSYNMSELSLKGNVCTCNVKIRTKISRSQV